MEPVVETVVDVLILMAVSSYTLVALYHAKVMWNMRKQFLIALRSPLLGCLCGVCSTVRSCSMTYVAAMYDYYGAEDSQTLKFTGAFAVNELIGSPASLVAIGALIAWAVRLLVLYDPMKRKRWGRYVREKPIAYALCLVYGGMEAVIWVFAALFGSDR
ncbi:unnamed protein product [Ectocarpus fasciculatus]